MAEQTIRGSFPGGPRKSAPAGARTSAPRLERVEQIEAGVARRRLRMTRRERHKRLAYGLVTVVVVAGGVGVYTGWRSHTTAEQLRAEAEAAVATEDIMDLSKEVNRTLLELWKMEDVEFMRNNRGR